VKILDQYETLQTIYSEIVEGCSYCHDLKCYVKHFNDRDFAEIYRARDHYLITEVGDIPTEAEKLKEITEAGIWTEQDEDDLITLQWAVEDNTKQIENIVSPEQREIIQKIVDEKQEELNEVEAKKLSYLHPNKDFYSRKYVSESIPYFALFKDRNLTERFFLEEKYENLDEEEITEIAIKYTLSLKKFNSRNLRLLATFPFVLNQLSLCRKNALIFLNKPVVEFTNYQLDLFNRTMRNLNVLENAEGNPPDIDKATDEQEILDWYDKAYSVWQGKNSKDQPSEIKKTTNYVER